MTGEIVSAAQILAGTGAVGWLADKLLGPSAQGLGEQIKAYGTDRLRKILGKTNSKVDEARVRPLPPGFAMTFFQKASFSEDDEGLTEMWANLLASAAMGYSSRHPAYVEILSQLTAFDAMTLGDLVPLDTAYFPQISVPVNLKIELRNNIARGIRNISDTQEEAQAEMDRLLNLDLTWPGRINSARIYFKGEERNHALSGGRPDQFAAFDNLTRLGLIERFDISNSLTPYDVAVEGVLVTMLGIGFIQTCRGVVLK